VPGQKNLHVPRRTVVVLMVPTVIAWHAMQAGEVLVAAIVADPHQLPIGIAKVGHVRVVQIMHALPDADVGHARRFPTVVVAFDAKVTSDKSPLQPLATLWAVQSAERVRISPLRRDCERSEAISNPLRVAMEIAASPRPNT
jgi:hypothetical protein